jgi:hypothetical protein
MGSMKSASSSLGFRDYGAQKSTEADYKKQQKISKAYTDAEIKDLNNQYSAWKDIYGDTQEDLATYFKNISGNTLANAQIEEIQKQSQLAQEQIDTELAQRGIQGSGLEASLTRQNIFGTAMEKAKVRSQADEIAAQQKMSFLQMGLPREAQIQDAKTRARLTGAQTAAGLAGTALQSMTSISNTGTSNTTQKSMEIGESITGMFGSDERLKENIVLAGVINNVNFYTWTWNAIANELGYYGTSFGVIAQEVRNVYPTVVGEKDGYLAVNYEELMNYIGDV